jgi:putative DNA primase/helicase
MVARVTSLVTGAPMSLHFTALALDGSGKAPIDKPKRLLADHRKQGGVIRLTPDAEVTIELGIAEGAETALAVANALGPFRPIWSAIDAGNLATLPIVPAIERLVIYADTDPSGTGQAAARTLAQRWHRAGRKVFIAQPSGGKSDWNDRVAAC